MKRSLQTAMDFGAEGIRIRVAGRLGGADIARAEWYREGKVPLQTCVFHGLRIRRSPHRLWHHRREVLGQQEGGRPPVPRGERARQPGARRRPGGRGATPPNNRTDLTPTQPNFP